MTKDEAIERLRAFAESVEEAMPKSDWIHKAAKKVLSDTSGTSCVCGDPEATGTTHRADGPCYQSAVTASLVSATVAEKLANEYVCGSVVSDFQGPKVTLRYQTTAAAEAAFEAITDAIDGQISAQPAADPAPACSCSTCVPNSPYMVLCATCGNKRCPQATDHRNACTDSNEPGQVGSSYEHCAIPDTAPVPAQGIDHAKRAEGERAAFEEFAKGARFFELERTRDGAYAFAATRCAWMAWQARGQQAGVPEGFVQAVRVMVANDGGDGSRYDAGALIKARDSVKAMLAAAPGEAG